jgi:hypothetical protein
VFAVELGQPLTLTGAMGYPAVSGTASSGRGA